MARYADIAVNLTDPMFQGIYHGKKKHAPDLDAVISRAKSQGVQRMLITGTSLSESREALEMAKRYDLHCTAGVHPTSTSEIDKHPQGADACFQELEQLIEADRGEGGSKRIISLGEIGLDYDRLNWSPKETQLRHLPRLLLLSKRFRLPMFLHSRTPESHVDLIKAMRDAGWVSPFTEGTGAGEKEWVGGVVHSFTGTTEEVKELVDMGLYIGLNGCSLKTAENLETVKTIPLDRIMLETDAPWCSITTSHASHPFLPPTSSSVYIQRVNKAEKWQEGQGVKGRMEPADVAVIAEVVARVNGVKVEEVIQAAWGNTERLFW
ncbi:uncharacterized protein MKK02DRAFT_35211 [Dioszegia hungarica]|uniref:Mg-dependent DNase n=1 Tax=Dioszegia hungarica TaxID=4972 RepID=A0AA38H3D0_9TREE|nr:uncharacterized protein MKK02DRAFT_35211 [Dioszegia hungarica]KAI9632991.1 hypothetical protein MKK02DRAFT_35211 [Dioszegia hungarica]